MNLIKKMLELIKKKMQSLRIYGKKKGRQTSVPAVMSMGPNRILIRILWGVLIFSVLFGVYKNFTAIDKETIHEREIIEEKLIDTNAVESYVKHFARIYHSWGNTPDAIKERKQALNQYLTDELLRINEGAITTDCPTTAEAVMIDIWSLAEKQEGEYAVEYSVTQRLQENETETEVAYAFQVTVHVDESGDMIIVRNPTMCSLPKKSGYAPAEWDTDGSVDSGIRAEIEEFLNTFFALYPKANEKELLYYVKDGVLDAVNRDYVYAGIMSPTYIKEGGTIKVSVYVKYLDQETKITQTAQYQLTLDKGENWRIISTE